MRLQLNLGLAVEVRHVGKLALVGKAETFHGGKHHTLVTFLLVCPSDAPLVQYFYSQTGFSEGELLFAVLEGEGTKLMETLDGNNKVLVFTREVDGDLRDPSKFLHATAEKIRGELQNAEDNDLALLEADDELEWCEHSMLHPGRRGSMPDFTRPRHD